MTLWEKPFDYSSKDSFNRPSASILVKMPFFINSWISSTNSAVGCCRMTGGGLGSIGDNTVSNDSC